MKKKIEFFALFLLACSLSLPRFSKSKPIKEIEDKAVLRKLLKNRYKQNEAYSRLMCILKKKIIAGNHHLVEEMTQLPLNAYTLGVDVEVILKGFVVYEDILQHLRESEKKQSFLSSFKHFEFFRKKLSVEQERIVATSRSSDFSEEREDIGQISAKNRSVIRKFKNEECLTLKVVDELLEDLHHSDRKFLSDIEKNIPREFSCHKWAVIYLRLQEIESGARGAVKQKVLKQKTLPKIEYSYAMN